MRLISKSELAEIAGVRPPSITLACKKAFPAALVDGRVDFDHVDVQRYLANKDGVATRVANRLLGPAPKALAPRPSMADVVAAERELHGDDLQEDGLHDDDRGEPTSAGNFRATPRRRMQSRRRLQVERQPKPDLENSEILRYLDMTLREMLQIHGTFEGFGDFLIAQKRLRDIAEKDLRLAREKKQLVSRDLVSRYVFGYLSSAHRRLLTDTAATIARMCDAEVKAGSDVDAIECKVRQLITQQLEPARRVITMELRGEARLRDEATAQQVEADLHAPVAADEASA